MGLSGHQSAQMKNDEWLTPPEILRALGPFALVAYGSANLDALRNSGLGFVVVGHNAVLSRAADEPDKSR